MWQERVSLRKMALSTSSGRLVAATTTTRDFGLDANPSHSVINCALMAAEDSWSVELRVRRKASISSINTMLGCSFSASVKIASTFCTACEVPRRRGGEQK